MNSFFFFLVLWIPNTDRPTFTMMQGYSTAGECVAVLERAPKDVASKFSCVEINMTPTPILPRNTL